MAAVWDGIFQSDLEQLLLARCLGNGYFIGKWFFLFPFLTTIKNISISISMSQLIVKWHREKHSKH